VNLTDGFSSSHLRSSSLSIKSGEGGAAIAADDTDWSNTNAASLLFIIIMWGLPANHYRCPNYLFET
jgi:hypothetical protein